MRTVPFGPYEGRTVDDVLILDPIWLLIQHEGGGYILTGPELKKALQNIDEVDGDVEA